MAQYYLLGDFAKILKRQLHQIAYLVTTGQVPEPEKRIANKRLITEQDVLSVARRLKAEPDWYVVGRDVDVGEPEQPEGLTLRASRERLS